MSRSQNQPRQRTAPTIRTALSAAVLAGLTVSLVSLADSLVRANPLEVFGVASTIGASAAFTAALCAQSLRVRSVRLAHVAAVAAVALFVLAPGVAIGLRSSGPSEGVDYAILSAMLMFTYSIRGWVAVGAAVAFVLTLRHLRILEDR